MFPATTPHSPAPYEIKPLGAQLFRRRDLLPQESSFVWRIENGFVRSLTWDEEGRAIVLGIWGPGDWVCLPLAPIAPLHIECLTAVEVVRCRPDETTLPLMLRNQALRTECLLRLLQHRLTPVRLQRTLEWMVGEFGYETTQGCCLGIPLTHQDLADLIGSTRVTVTRLLHEWKKSGFLKPQKRYLLIQDHFFKADVAGSLTKYPTKQVVNF